MTFHDIFLRNWLQKAISLVLALGLFFFVRNMRITERTIEVPLQVKNAPTYLVPVNRIPESVSIRISGVMRKVSKVDSGKISVSIDMTDAVPGLNEFPIAIHYPDFSDDIQLTTAMRALRIQFDYILERLVPVRPVLIGTPGKGHVLTSSNIEPAMVLLSGPAMVLSNLASLPILPFSIDGLVQSVATPVQLDLQGMNLSQKQSVQLMLRLRVADENRTRAIGDLPLTLIGPDPGRVVRAPALWPRVRVVVGGEADALAKLDPTTLKVLLRLTNLEAGLHELAPFVVLPDNLVVRKIEPQTIAVELGAQTR